ncbi:hypothetical protein VNO77_19807 [Canavalia gladiata]|uniref:Uncharacterized protein n=1 Tax=Canavalia gladiata TaxID=3824 RepID=A0AAN9QLT3_CANGL
MCIGTLLIIQHTFTHSHKSGNSCVIASQADTEKSDSRERFLALQNELQLCIVGVTVVRSQSVSTLKVDLEFNNSLIQIAIGIATPFQIISLESLVVHGLAILQKSTLEGLEVLTGTRLFIRAHGQRCHKEWPLATSVFRMLM